MTEFSDVCQKHISEKVGSSYPVSKATELVNIAAHLGFGEVIEAQIGEEYHDLERGNCGASLKIAGKC